MPGLRNW